MWYDVVVLAILVFCVIRGASKGVVWQLAAVAALLLCFVFAETGSLAIAPFIKVKEPLNRWIAMFLLYIVFSFLAFAVARQLSNWIEKAQFSEYDRHLGAVVGFAKGVIFCLVMTFFVVTLSESARGHVLGSYSGYASAVIMDRLHPVMPEQLHAVIEPYIHQLDQPGMPLKYADDHDHDHDDSPHGGRKDDDDHFGRDHGFDNPFASFPADDDDPFGNESGGENPFGGQSADENPFATEEPWPDDAGESRGVADSEAGGTNPLDDLVGKIPGLREGEAGRTLVDMFNNASPEERRRITDGVRSTLPDVIRASGLEPRFTNDPPGSRPSEAQPSGSGSGATFGAGRADRARVLREIAGIYHDSPSDQTRFIERAEESLTGVPDRVAAAVLDDWRGDVLAARVDADPETTVSTTLDERIVRQLRKANVPLDSLSSTLRRRLQDLR